MGRQITGILLLLSCSAAIEGRASAQAPTVAEARFEAGSSWLRSSSGDLPDDVGRRDAAYHIGLGGGLRWFPFATRHGLLAAAFRLRDKNLDHSWWNEGGPQTEAVHLIVAYVGYVYRVVWPIRQRSDRAFAVSLHGSLGSGVAQSPRFGELDLPGGNRLLSVRVGVDADVHIGPVFFGWSLRYGIVHHDRGRIELSHLFSANVIPLVRVGIDFGRPAQGVHDRQPR